MKKQETKLTYQSAYAELQHIMQEVQSETVGIDDLAAKIARASELIRFCRERLRMTEEEMKGLEVGVR
jgi:exodeoxyribonuclease VII small subunit